MEVKGRYESIYILDRYRATGKQSIVTPVIRQTILWWKPSCSLPAPAACLPADGGGEAERAPLSPGSPTLPALPPCKHYRAGMPLEFGVGSQPVRGAGGAAALHDGLSPVAHPAPWEPENLLRPREAPLGAAVGATCPQAMWCQHVLPLLQHREQEVRKKCALCSSSWHSNMNAEVSHAAKVMFLN